MTQRNPRRRPWHYVAALFTDLGNGMYNHFLVPVDGTMLSATNVEAATGLAARLGARITFFHATRDLGSTGEGALLRSISPDTFLAAVTGDTQAVLSRAAADADAAGVQCSTISRVCDRAAESIVEVAKDQGCDLIVMASRGARGVEGWLHSSRTEEVLRRSPMALLVTRVASNDPLSSRERALGIIQEEHRSIAVVVRGMWEAAQKIEQSPSPQDCAGLEGMLAYLREFPLRLHHPKEEEYLHPAMRKRFAPADALLLQIEAQHVREYALIDEVALRLAEATNSATGASGALAAAMRSLADATWQHIGLEEREVLPMAQQCLIEEDWDRLAKAFEENRDRGFGELAGTDFRRLFAQIANALSEARH